MKKDIIKIFVNLFKVRSVCTILLVAPLSIGFLKGLVSTEVYVPIVTLALTSLYKKNEITEKKEEEL